jgi:hypothetical protein
MGPPEFNAETTLYQSSHHYSGKVAPYIGFHVVYILFFMRMVIKLAQYYDNVKDVNDFDGLDIKV